MFDLRSKLILGAALIRRWLLGSLARTWNFNWRLAVEALHSLKLLKILICNHHLLRGWWLRITILNLTLRNLNQIIVLSLILLQRHFYLLSFLWALSRIVSKIDCRTRESLWASLWTPHLTSLRWDFSRIFLLFSL